MTMLRLGLLTVTALLFGTTAHAQGAPPFDLGAPASSSQIVEMELNADDPQELTNPVRTVEISSLGEERLVRDQQGTNTGKGSLRMFPGSINYLIFPFQGPPVGGDTLVDDGSRSYIVSHAESGFDLPAGTLDADVEASTPDYGLDGPGAIRHRIRARASAGLQDWIYVTGAGTTATLVMTATLDESADAPVPPDRVRSVPGLGDAGLRRPSGLRHLRGLRARGRAPRTVQHQHGSQGPMGRGGGLRSHRRGGE